MLGRDSSPLHTHYVTGQPDNCSVSLSGRGRTTATTRIVLVFRTALTSKRHTRIFFPAPMESQVGPHELVESTNPGDVLKTVFTR